MAVCSDGCVVPQGMHARMVRGIQCGVHKTTMAHCKGFREGERGWDVHFVADSAQVVTTPTCDTETGGGGGGGEREDDVNSSPSYPSLFSSQP